MTICRRSFLGTLAGLITTGLVSAGLPMPVRRKTGEGFFSLKRIKDRWWLMDSGERPFWSIGINHVDAATLRYEDSGNVWETLYHNDMELWLKAVKQDLIQWGFNTLGWNQEVVTINDQNHRHSRSFTFEEYQWLDMPYCHLLPFIESHQWEVETRLPDIRSKGFEEWCDYVARDQCARMKDDPDLIGYFFTDCPTWTHSNEQTAWKAPIFDPDLLKGESGRKELFNLATVYYRVIHRSIRRYDQNHLILGDRYEANALLPREVVQAALPYVDVLSFQCFGGADRVGEKLGFWASETDRPILLADSAVWAAPHTPGWPPKEQRHQDPEGYEKIIDVLKGIPQCIGFHLCGAYLQNKVRNFGLRNYKNQVDHPSTSGISEINNRLLEWVDKETK